MSNLTSTPVSASVFYAAVDYVCARIMARMLIWGEDFATAQEAVLEEIRNGAAD